MKKCSIATATGASVVCALRPLLSPQAKAAADAKAAVRSRNIRDAKIIGGTVVGTTAVVGGIGIPLAIQEGKRRGRDEGPSMSSKLPKHPDLSIYGIIINKLK